MFVGYHGYNTSNTDVRYLFGLTGADAKVLHCPTRICRGRLSTYP